LPISGLFEGRQKPSLTSMMLRRAERLKRELYPRLIYSPFLRLILFNFWFRLAFVGFLSLLIFLALTWRRRGR
jgi:hypothetical protein